MRFEKERCCELCFKCFVPLILIGARVAAARASLLDGPPTPEVVAPCYSPEIAIPPPIRRNISIVDSSRLTQYFISSKFLLKPEQQRKRIDTSVTISLLQSGGIMKGNGGVNYLDVYDKDNKYRGSIKTPLSVFKTDIKKLIPGFSLYSIVRTDKQIHESSQGIYYYMEGSEFDKAVRAEVGLKEAKQRLRAVMKD